MLSTLIRSLLIGLVAGAYLAAVLSRIDRRAAYKPRVRIKKRYE